MVVVVFFMLGLFLRFCICERQILQNTWAHRRKPKTDRSTDCTIPLRGTGKIGRLTQEKDNTMITLSGTDQTERLTQERDNGMITLSGTDQTERLT